MTTTTTTKPSDIKATPPLDLSQLPSDLTGQIKHCCGLQA